jgi:hypothetical protein
MKESVSKLWQKIQTFSLDNPVAEVTFSQKLAREQKWTRSFTHRAIAEYKKFMLLCATCPNGASPSETVDKVWHLHLTYTTSYWIDFCQNTLGKDIHHYPSNGGAAENQKHKDWYSDTLQHYVFYFDQPPSADIWEYPANFVLENHLSAHTLYRKVPVQTAEPHVLSKNAKYFLYAYLVVLVILVAFFGNPFTLDGRYFLTFYTCFAIATILPIMAEIIDRKMALNKTKSLLPEGLHSYHLAYLLGGKERMLETAIVELADNEVLSLDRENKNFVIHRGSVTAALERNPLYHTVVALEGYETDGQTLSEIFESCSKPLSDSINLNNLEFQPNFIVKQAQFIWYYIGMIRLVQGIITENLILFLFLFLLIYWFIKLMMMEYMKEGYHVSNLVREKYQNHSNENTHIYALDGNNALAGIAVFEVGLMFAALNHHQKKSSGTIITSCSSGDSGDWSGNSSDGGGNDGDGCSGGCGGCGGGCGGS